MGQPHARGKSGNVKAGGKNEERVPWAEGEKVKREQHLGREGNKSHDIMSPVGEKNARSEMI